MKHITFSHEELDRVRRHANIQTDVGSPVGPTVLKLLAVQRAWEILRGEMNHDMARESKLQRKEVVDYMNRIELDLEEGRLS